MDEPDYDEFSSYRNFLSCSNVQSLEYKDRCEYVRTTIECQEKKQFINYIDLLYCTLRPTSDAQQYWSLILLMSLCSVMFVILAITADKFFCPALEVLSKCMGLSEHLAGVTLLAFGNGSPDIFTNFASINEPSGTMYTNMLGSSIYITGFIGGIICVIRSFRMDASNILRDISFFIFGILYLDYVIKDGKVTMWESIGLIMIYVAFLLTILMDQYLLKRSVMAMEKLAQTEDIAVDTFKRYSTLRQEANIEIKNEKPRRTQIDLQPLNTGANYQIFTQFKESLRPVDSMEWLEASCFRKFLMSLKAPIMYGLLLLLPCVNYETDTRGWSKLLNCLQIVILPFATILLIFGISYWPLSLYSLAVTVPLSGICLYYSRTTEAPRFHVFFALLSAYGSTCIIFSCASEVVEILFVLGIVLDCSKSFLGCTLMAWGNGIGDLIANVTLALHGYPKMAFAASIGGPFFNTLVGIGSVMLIKNLNSDAAMEPGKLPAGAFGENCFVFLLLILFGTLTWSITTNFHIRRCVGVFNICLYFLFFVYTLLGEIEVIQTFAEISQYGAE